jgi:hypothetical protein
MDKKKKEKRENYVYVPWNVKRFSISRFLYSVSVLNWWLKILILFKYFQQNLFIHYFLKYVQVP